jgi:hypothetical protein
MLALRDQDRLPPALLAYAVALALLLIVPPYLGASVGPPEKFTLQEAADLFTPIVVMPLAYLVLVSAGATGRATMLAFVVIAAVWVEGQGIHLAANAVGDAFPEEDVKAFYDTIPGDLNHYLDEELSHWMWHGAWIALSALLLLVGGGGRLRAAAVAPPIPGLAGLIHGAVFFLVTVEGQTTAIGIPASAVFLAWGGASLVRGPRTQAIPLFLAVSSALTLVGYFAWAATHDWTLPEFSAVGLF